ncbi:MAG: pyruvate dehydrogenase (acetyl-transferring) E1 component subunit alpha [Proteobacteria bacterium]|nr:pyruvate dehydrogenase (acetyl-transferring) E1 component subunit alpha [Pseudomonadota bacterium]
MLLIRRFEEKAGQLYGMGLIGGFCHLYIGQEAIVTGIQSVQEPQDTVITTYRDHGHMLACGMDAKGVMAELTGRIGGYSRGKGGSMHMFSSEAKFYGGHGIVGASGSLGTGLAFAHQYSGDKGVTLAYMGDGAANQGQTFECMNMAALWKLPVVYVIENNQYGMGTAASRHAAGELWRRGEAFGIPGEKVDGSDVLEVQAVARQVLDHVRSGKGPYVLEMNTYRFRGHSMSDPGKYRSKEELEKAKAERDPLEKLKAVMIGQAGFVEADFDPFEKEIKAIVNESAEFAQQSPEPHPDELWTDVLIPVSE